MTTVTAEAIEIRRVIDATPAEAWTAWTDPDLLAQWFAPGRMRAEVLGLEVRPGGNYRIRMHDEDGSSHTVFGRYIEVEDGRRLVMTWAWENGESGESRVSVEFAKHAGGTEILILHEGLPDTGSIERHRAGWLGCLDKLEGTAT